MRSYAKVYNSETRDYRIIFRDDTDPTNTFYVDVESPPFQDADVATLVVNRLNREGF